VTASFAQQEIWHVMIASDDMKRMNVDQLDDAFRLDLVDTSTLVWKTGMEGWRRLGSIAGIDDEPETIARPLGPPARPFGPPSPPPPPRPPRPQHQTRSVAPEVNPFLTAPVNPFASTTPAAVFSAPKLLAPVYTPPIVAPDPYVMPKRRAKVPSEVDFRRAPGIRWGRWMFGFLLLTGGVLAAYRQDYLRQGARQLGMENKYIHGERRVTGWVTAKTPPVVQAALTRAKLLPGPNALPAAAPPKPAASPAPVLAAAAVTEPAKTSTPTTDSDGVKTVSLDSLPTEQATPEPTPAAATPAPAPRSKPAVAARAEPKAAAAPKPAKKQAAAAEDDEPAPAPKAKAEPKPEAPKPEPKAPKAPPPAMNDTPLKAAIWQAMQESAKKGK
jgi:hypothetical protein